MLLQKASTQLLSSMKKQIQNKTKEQAQFASNKAASEIQTLENILWAKCIFVKLTPEKRPDAPRLSCVILFLPQTYTRNKQIIGCTQHLQ